MEDNKMQIIGQLMEELQDLMGQQPEDFDERLGREKPSIEVMKVDSDEPMDGDDVAMDGDSFEMNSPEEKLKNRLMKLRA